MMDLPHTEVALSVPDNTVELSFQAFAAPEAQSAIQIGATEGAIALGLVLVLMLLAYIVFGWSAVRP